MSGDFYDSYLEVDTETPRIDSEYLLCGDHIPSAAHLLLQGDAMHEAAYSLIEHQCMRWAVLLRRADYKGAREAGWFPDERELAQFGNVINAQLSEHGVPRMGEESHVKWVALAKEALIGTDED